MKKTTFTLNEVIERLEEIKKFQPSMGNELVFFKNKDGILSLIGDIEVDCNHTISFNEGKDDRLEEPLTQILNEAKRIALESVKGRAFFEKNTKLFFDGFSNLISSLSVKQTVSVQTLKDLLSLNNEAIFMLMKISKDEDLKALTFGHDLESFNMRYAQSFTAINAVLACDY